jgi:hypothetical protein
MKEFLNKLIIITPLFFCSCFLRDNQDFRSYQPKPYVKPVAKVEKVWTAQHKYDPERRLVIPMIGGSRWGAVHEYKEDGTLVYREWWERDIKKEDLDNVAVKESTFSNQKIESAVETDIGQSAEVNITDSELPDVVEPKPDNVPTPFDEVVPFDVGDSVNELPMAPLPFDSLPANDNPAPSIPNNDSPFAPLPAELPPFPAELPPL